MPSLPVSVVLHEIVYFVLFPMILFWLSLKNLCQFLWLFSYCSNHCFPMAKDAHKRCTSFHYGKSCNLICCLSILMQFIHRSLCFFVTLNLFVHSYDCFLTVSITAFQWQKTHIKDAHLSIMVKAAIWSIVCLSNAVHVSVWGWVKLNTLDFL